MAKESKRELFYNCYGHTKGPRTQDNFETILLPINNTTGILPAMEIKQSNIHKAGL